MNDFKKTIVLISASLGFLFCGCAHYRAAKLTSFGSGHVKDYSAIEGVSIGCLVFSKTDCLDYLDRDLVAKGYQPILLTFHNKTDQHYLFSTAGISLPCVKPEEVAEIAHTSTFGRVIVYSLGSFLFPPLIIVAVVDGIRSSEANLALDRDFADKGKQDFVINPGSFNQTIIFVRSDNFHPIFDLTLVERETGVRKTVGVETFR